MVLDPPHLRFGFADQNAMADERGMVVDNGLTQPADLGMDPFKPVSTRRSSAWNLWSWRIIVSATSPNSW
jgi:hypothetical protein